MRAMISLDKAKQASAAMVLPGSTPRPSVIRSRSRLPKLPALRSHPRTRVLARLPRSSTRRWPSVSKSFRPAARIPTHRLPLETLASLGDRRFGGHHLRLPGTPCSDPVFHLRGKRLVKIVQRDELSRGQPIRAPKNTPALGEACFNGARLEAPGKSTWSVGGGFLGALSAQLLRRSRDRLDLHQGLITVEHDQCLPASGPT